MGTRFKSKVDAWLAVVLIAGVIMCAGATLTVMRAAVPHPWLIVTPLLLIGAVLPISLLLRTDYTVEDDVLLVRCGLFRRRLLLRDITDISPTRNPTSSPALSLDRLLITGRNGPMCMVSPRDKDGFIRELQNRGVTVPPATPTPK